MVESQRGKGDDDGITDQAWSASRRLHQGAGVAGALLLVG
jgi:hypothetical protein